MGGICGKVVNEVMDELDGSEEQQGGERAAPGTRSPANEDPNQAIQVGLDDEDPEVEMSTCDGNRKALFIGINYFGTRAELRGCINDVHNLHEWLTTTQGFDPANCHILTDDKQGDKSPTKANILREFEWLVRDAKPGDSLFLHYSGHGGTEKDVDPDTDEVDGQDETIIPVDYEHVGQIVDDEINRKLVKALPRGVRLTAIFDSCHSGSVMDLPYTYGVDEQGEVHEVNNRVAWKSALEAGVAWIKGDKAGAMSKGMEALGLMFKGGGGGGSSAPATTKPKDGIASSVTQSAREAKMAFADVIQFAGCRDEQTSADATLEGQATGAMSYAFIKAFEENPQYTFLELLMRLRAILAGKFSQIPQMSAGHKMPLATTKWIMCSPHSTPPPMG